ncbi:MAG: hypothetical protein H7317_02765 [Pseudorhodobacter sp.]|nr:hypothetical protein [Pseudorhodobacter sp.]
MDDFVFGAGDGRDRVTDFTKAQDVITLNADLWGGGLTARQVVHQFATIRNGDMVFDFGDDVLTLLHVSSISGMAAHLVFA